MVVVTGRIESRKRAITSKNMDRVFGVLFLATTNFTPQSSNHSATKQKNETKLFRSNTARSSIASPLNLSKIFVCPMEQFVGIKSLNSIQKFQNQKLRRRKLKSLECFPVLVKLAPANMVVVRAPAHLRRERRWVRSHLAENPTPLWSH